MVDFVITTDNMADLPEKYAKDNDLGVLSLTYMIDGETYDNNNELPYKIFYDKMRRGSMPTTSQINFQSATEGFEGYLKEGKNVLHIAFSSALSGSYGNAVMAAKELEKVYPNGKVIVIDSLSASLGQGLLVHLAIQQKKQGRSLEEVQDYVEKVKLKICHRFTVDDLFHLYRGGRVSRTSAIIGTVVGIKPILYVDDEGKLTPQAKVRGRKKSLMALVDDMEKHVGDFIAWNDVIFISHGDCIQDAEYVRDLIMERFGIQSFLINHVGPTIGAHSGPGTVALFFVGEKR